ncbi:MAG: hypothetical protein ACKVS8_07455 [Phycisphaerales bacterium]
MWNPFHRKRIRKDASELTLADLQHAPVWEFCLDEEGVKGQTECTVRPLFARAVDARITDCLVVADFVSPGGRVYAGTVRPAGNEFRGAWCADATILLPRPVGELVEHPLLQKYNKVMMHSSPCVGLALPWLNHETEENIRILMDLAYRALGAPARQLFPLTCRPRASIEGWPTEVLIEGFLWPEDRGGETFKPVL